MSIFPNDYSINKVRSISYSKKETAIPMLKLFKIDYEKDDIWHDSEGNFEIVEGLEAIGPMIWMMKKVRKDRWLIFEKIGNKLKDLRGNYEDCQYNAFNIVKEAFVDGEYITGINNVETSFEGSKLKISFNIESIYGITDMTISK